jgi:hypothetical protein
MKINLANSSGSITTPLLIISSSLIVVIYGLVFMLSNQLDNTYRREAQAHALYIAEAGVQYYRWHLAHAPTDYADGTGDPPGPTGQYGPFVHDYQDPGGEVIGQFSLQITPPEETSSIVTIASTGWLSDYPEAKSIITVKYGIPSFTRFSNLTNAVAWYGSGITVHGLVHSNTGIRMDGENTSKVTAAQDEYTCNFETGCSPTETKPGVWGDGSGSGLWEYPVPPIDFDSIFFDFSLMQQSAIDNGLYLDNIQQSRGYHLVFKVDGTFDVYNVTSTDSYKGYATYEGCRRLNLLIDQETLIGNYSVADNPIVFIEDDTWVEGVVNGKLTIAAAQFPLQSMETDIVINNNLTYLEKDGSSSLGLIALNDVIFGRDIPTDFKIDGALMAQNGKIIRHGFLSFCGSSSNAVRDSLTIFGALLSNQKSYWNFGSEPSSGFITRTILYDSNLEFGPPPYFPTNGDYEFISWEE